MTQHAMTPIQIPQEWADNALLTFEEFCELIHPPNAPSATGDDAAPDPGGPASTTPAGSASSSPKPAASSPLPRAPSTPR